MAISRKSASRKSASRKSASRKSSSRKSSLINSSNASEQSTNYIFSLIVNILIVYYLINLEAKTCNCIRDWRHNYIKFTTIFNIILTSLILFGLIKQVDLMNMNLIMFILTIINIYAFYTYIGDLDETKCECAVSKQKNLHKFLNLWRYIMVYLPIFLIICALIIYFILKNQMKLRAL